MTKNADLSTLKPAELSPPHVHAYITKRKKIFTKYNIKRLNDLIRNLSPKKRRMFNTIPFLLHVNSPDFPGFVDHAACPYGIFGFHDSGFWKLSLKHGKFDEKRLHPYLSKKYHILGLYLMGSSGTLAQSEKSDFDFWVLIDQSTITTAQLGYLSQKLEKITIWAKEKFNHDVTFFILDVTEIKNNRYQAVDEESSGTAQRTILKEEFYRTFIMIAGRVPYWAVVPPGCDNETYTRIISLSLTDDVKGVIRENYIDLGNLTEIRKSECPGALLWQLNKANSDPAKALIKACLIAYYNNMKERELLPCDFIKKKYAAGIFGGSLNDPYAIIFEKVMHFSDTYAAGSYAEAIRESIFLRLNEYLSSSIKEMADSKQTLIDKYIHIWGWDRTKIDRFRSYRDWPEMEKTAYDEYLVGKISTLYDKVIRKFNHSRQKTDMRPSDFKNLRNRIATHFRKTKDKIPRCSSYLNYRSRDLSLTISPEPHRETGVEWVVYDTPLTIGKSSVPPLFRSDELLRMAGFIMANGLYREKPENVFFQQTHLDLPIRHVRTLFSRIACLIPPLDTESIDFQSMPTPYRMVIMIDIQSHYDPNSFNSAQCLVQNTWGEMDFHELTISRIATLDQKCYKIAMFIRKYQKQSSDGQFAYDIVLLRMRDKNETIQKIEAHLARLEQKNSVIVQEPDGVPFENSLEVPNDGFLLDE